MNELSPHALETVPEDEAAAIVRLQKMQLLFMKRDESQRGQHPKSTGCVEAEFAVRADIPPEWRQGALATASKFAAIVRFSNGAAFDDREADARGIALKVLGVAGPRVLEEEGDRGNWDLLLVNSPIFFCQSVTQLLGFMQAQLKARGEPPADWLQEHPAQAAALQRFVSAPPSSLLACEYHSTTPYLLGDRAVKYALYPVPSSPGGSAAIDSPDGLLGDLFERLSSGDATFTFGVHPQVDPASQPVEDPTLEWKTPFVPLADLVIPRGQRPSDARAAFAEALSYSPWRAPVAHRPLGGINRARLPVYAASSQKRHSKTGQGSGEPANIDALP